METTDARKRLKTPRNAATRETARKMYLRGLYLTEISILLNVPLRTLEDWQGDGKWGLLKKTTPIKQRAKDLKEAGYTAREIAGMLDVHPRTVFRWAKQVKQAENGRKNG